MKVIVGDELGLLKCIDAQKSIMESKFGEIKKDNAVVGLDNLFNDNKSILSVLHEENFYLMDWNDKSIKYQQTINQKYTSQVVKKGTDSSLVCLSNQKNELELFQFDQNFEVLNYVNFNTENRNLFKIKNSYVENEIFLLNKKYPFQIYDINKNCITWKSKNVPNDELDLMVPIWDTDICQNKSNPNLIYTSTAWGHIRAYDRKIKPRPIEDRKIYKNKINRIIQTPDDNYIIAGDTIGHLYFLDKRKNYHKCKCLMGHIGSIKDLQHSDNGSILFSTGLDRFLRVFEYKKNSEMPHIYLKNKLNCVLPIEVEWKEEDDNLEYWEEEEKNDDEMNDELSIDSEIQQEGEENHELVKKILELNVKNDEEKLKSNKKKIKKIDKDIDKKSESEDSEKDELDDINENSKNKDKKKKSLLNKKTKQTKKNEK